MQDIIEYEHNYVKDNIGIIIEKIKKLVEKNIIISSNYKFVDIKSIDIIFIFFEIVKFTKDKPVTLIYFNDETGQNESIEFSSETFNYFKIDEELNQSYNKIDKSFDLNGYKYSLPSLGIENSLTNFLINKSIDPEAAKYKTLNYNFTYFLGHKNNVSYSEIENLIQIFNYDMDKSEIKKVSDIVKKISPMQRYSLKKGSKIIELNSKIDLEKIWK
jgi:hypothetical protein